MANFGFSRLRVVTPYDVAFREARSAVGAAPLLQRAEANEQITERFLDVLRQSGYINPVTAAPTEEKVRRLVRRLDIAGKDAPVLLGMLRQILWKLGQEQ